MWPLLTSWSSSGLFFVLIQWIEELQEKLRKCERLRVVQWPVSVYVILSAYGIIGNFESGIDYFSASSSFVKPTEPYCISSSRSASPSGDLLRLTALIVDRAIATNGQMFPKIVLQTSCRDEKHDDGVLL